jgi:hypothetical protein
VKAGAALALVAVLGMGGCVERALETSFDATQALDLATGADAGHAGDLARVPFDLARSTDASLAIDLAAPTDAATPTDAAMADLALVCDAGLGSDGGCACPPYDPAQGIFVNAWAPGPGNGSAACPLRSITAGLALADSDSAIATVTVRGRDPTLGGNVWYSAEQTGEIFPLVPHAGLTLQGDANWPYVGGAGDCGARGRCMFLITNADVTVSNFSLQASSDGADYGIIVDGGVHFTLRNANLHGVGTSLTKNGVLVDGASILDATYGWIGDWDGVGLRVQNGSQAHLDRFSLNYNGHGMVVGDTSMVTSSNGQFEDNDRHADSTGVTLLGQAQWTSTNDAVAWNGREGVLAGDPTDPTANANVIVLNSDGGVCIVSDNGQNSVGDGLYVLGSGSSLTMSGCQVLNNTGNGVRIEGDNTADLVGDAAPNWFQRATGGNLLAGVCNDTPNAIAARNDDWSKCTSGMPSTSAQCAAGVDIGLPGGGSVDGAGCSAP